MARILHVFRPRTGGTFGHVRALSSAQAERGHEVAVCGPEGGGFDVLHVEAPIPRSPSPAAATRAIGRVAGAYRSFRPDLIHAHGAQAGVVARLARAARPGAPLIHTPHRYAFEDGSGRSAATLAAVGVERSLMPLATRVLCVCEAEREIAVRIGARGRARVVHNGIDPLPPGEVPSAIAELGSQGPLIVAVSELFRRKGVEILIAAAPAILAAHPTAHLIVAGDGPERAAVAAARDRLGLADRVHLLGHVDGVAGLLGAADVYVNPALAEAFPYGVLEAMSAACPCVVTDAGGTAEAVIDGESGRVVAPGDPGVLAAAISSLLADPVHAKRLGDSARDRVLSTFSKRRMIDGTAAVYAELGVS